MAYKMSCVQNPRVTYLAPFVRENRWN